MEVGSHNFIKFTVTKPNCQKHSDYVSTGGKNAIYPTMYGVSIVYRLLVKLIYYLTRDFSDTRIASALRWRCEGFDSQPKPRHG